ncbi:hypothetical protein [Anaerostipes sp.]|uniref:hypothetical protein n=1 Tax=Anaerostipes sp. TaxID=1872530 RepID=UPI0025C0722F|nr:hypothetical protein [Anaerostipes sp.]MBS7009457.1 hypothetical protein [Anaerostipes sp.]
MRDKIQNFLRGRYGTDSLSKFLLTAALVGMFLPILIKKAFLFYYLGLILLVYSYSRILSRNISKRSAENAAFLRKTRKITGFFSKKKLHFEQRKTHRFFRCPGCGQDIRVPKGKGKIVITCPKCRREFQAKS